MLDVDSGSSGPSLGQLESSSFVEILDSIREEADERQETEQRFIASTVTVSTAFSVGYVVWLVRGGVLLTSVLSSLPAWRMVDPLPVLGRMDEDEEQAFADEEDEGLDEMVARTTPGEEQRP